MSNSALINVSDDEIIHEFRLRKSRKRRMEVERLLNHVAKLNDDVDHYRITAREHNGTDYKYVFFSIEEVSGGKGM